ncbi:hypothetical protein, partial [Escherichia coli]
ASGCRNGNLRPDQAAGVKLCGLFRKKMQRLQADNILRNAQHRVKMRRIPEQKNSRRISVKPEGFR